VSGEIVAKTQALASAAEAFATRLMFPNFLGCFESDTCRESAGDPGGQVPRSAATVEGWVMKVPSGLATCVAFRYSGIKRQMPQ
jgi:hypothetical protein